MRRTPLSWRRGESIIYWPYNPPLRFHKGEVSKHISEGEFGWDGAGEPRILCCEAGNYSNWWVHYDTPRLPKQGALCNTDDGSDHWGGIRRRPFRECGAIYIIEIRIHRIVWICATGRWSIPVQRQGVWREPPAYYSLWQSRCHCH